MNRIQIGGYTRITKKEAARRYNAGEVIRLTACKLSPVSPWGCHSDAQRESYTQVSGDGFNTTVARNREFETVVNSQATGAFGLFADTLGLSFPDSLCTT